MGHKAIAAALIIFLAVEPAAAFLWPWQHHRRAVHRHRGEAPRARELVDCAKIRAAVSKMTPQAFASALADLSQSRIAIINKCITEPIP